MFNSYEEYQENTCFRSHRVNAVDADFYNTLYLLLFIFCHFWSVTPAHTIAKEICFVFVDYDLCLLLEMHFGFINFRFIAFCVWLSGQLRMLYPFGSRTLGFILWVIFSFYRFQEIVS